MIYWNDATFYNIILISSGNAATTLKLGAVDFIKAVSAVGAYLK